MTVNGFPFTNRYSLTRPLDRVADCTGGTAVATITTVTWYGGSLSLTLTADGATTVADLASNRVLQTPESLLKPGVKVTVDGTVRDLPGLEPYIEADSIAPAA